MSWLIIAGQTAREAFRSRTWSLTLASCLILIALAPSLPSFDLGVRLPLFLNLAYAVTYVTALGLTVGLTTTAVHRDIERRTALHILSRPVSKRAYLAGKLTGACLVVWGSLFLSHILIILVAYWQFGIIELVSLQVMLAQMAEMALIGSVATVLSFFLHPAVNLSLTALLYLAMQAAPAQLVGVNGLLSYLVPDLSRFAIGDAVAHGRPPGSLVAIMLLLYGLAWSFFLLNLGALAVARKELD